MAYYYGKGVNAPVPLPNQAASAQPAAATQDQTCENGYRLSLGQTCRFGFEKKTVNGVDMCCLKKTQVQPAVQAAPATAATPATTPVQAAPVTGGPTVQPQGGYGAAALSALSGLQVPGMAAPTTAAPQGEVTGVDINVQTCPNLCKEAGYNGGTIKGKNKACDSSQGYIEESFTLRNDTTKTCCCKGNSGPDPNAPEDCVEAYPYSASEILTGCKEGWEQKDYGADGKWCCKKEAAGVSPCVKGTKIPNGDILTGVGQRAQDPADCKIGRVGRKDNIGRWWCCETEVPEACKGGQRIQPNAKCPPEMSKKVIDGKSYCCPADCDPKKKDSCPSGYTCNPETKKCEFAEGVIVTRCMKDADCVKTHGKGAKCIEGQCVGPEDLEACPEGKGVEYAGCECGKTYVTMNGTCVNGYVLEAKTKGTTGWEGWKEGAKGRCDCIKWCLETGYDETCSVCLDPAKCAGKNDPMGEYQWPPELQDLYMKLIGQGGKLLTGDRTGGLGEYALPEDVKQLLSGITARGTEYLNRKPGYSDAILKSIYGANFDEIAKAQAASRGTLLDTLASEGLLDTGAKAEMMSRLAGQGEASLANLARDLFIQGEEKRKADLSDYTKAAEEALATVAPVLGAEEAAKMGRYGYGLEQKKLGQDFLGTGMQYNALQEQINAARRAEGSEAMAMLLQLLLLMQQASTSA